MITYVEGSMSLIERKKQQWAREREELSGLCAPWGAVRDPSFDDQFGSVWNIRMRDNQQAMWLKVSRLTGPSKKRQTSNSYSTNNSAYSKRDPSLTPRRSSLPPLYKNQYNSTDRYEREKDFGGETSGYGSDNPNIPEYTKTNNQNWHQTGYESSSSYREDRPKWGDRGVAVGSKFWGSRENLNCGKVATNEPPGWVKRGLEGDTQIVVANSSPAESPQQDCAESERPSTSSSNPHNRSYIRGQNAPIDQIEIMERERRRQAALAHQEAIRKQLEEREQKRKEEKERRIKEERDEELRIEREQELERKRREQELRAGQEKQERERKRKEALQEALAIAEKEAKLRKMKHKLSKQNNINVADNISDRERVASPRDECNNTVKLNNHSEVKTESILNNISKINNLDNENNNSNLSTSDKSKNDNDDNHNQATCQKVLVQTEITKDKDSRCNVSNDNNENQYNKNVTNTAPSHTMHNGNNDNNNNINIQRAMNNNPTIFAPQLTPRIENVALLLQPTLDTYQNMQYAVLVPNVNPTTHTAIPIAVPIPITTDRDLYTPRTENRILTPTAFRHPKTFCDNSTQTDYMDFLRLDTSDMNRGRFIAEKVISQDLSYEIRCRNKERRSSRNEERSREERPKWGANRPPTRYMKQSEKDPLYQRRKMRQKMRDNKLYEDKNSSDESQTASPRSYRKKTYVEKRHSRALWRKHDQIFAKNNIKMYQTEIIPLESDKDRIYYKESCYRECCCHCRCNKKLQESKVDILKIEHSSPRVSAFHRPDLLPTDFQENTIDENTFVDTSEQFSSLNNDLLPQEQWENSPARSPDLSASTRYRDNI